MQRIVNILSIYINDFIGLLYPNLCEACGRVLVKNETYICTRCLNQIPRTKAHNQKGHPIEQLFWGRVPVENVASLYYFLKGSLFQKLIHKIKYKNQKELGIFLGKQLGIEIKNSSWINDIDVIVPVPLHKKKKNKRGFNQSKIIAQGLSNILCKPIDITAVKRKVYNPTQTRKSRYQRWENAEGIFEVTNNNLQGKHILLIDDVVTTGATLEACVTAILKHTPNTKISICTLAAAVN